MRIVNNVVIVDKSVQQTQGVSVGGDSSKTALNMNGNMNNESQVMKKISTLALNK